MNAICQRGSTVEIRGGNILGKTRAKRSKDLSTSKRPTAQFALVGGLQLALVVCGGADKMSVRSRFKVRATLLFSIQLGNSGKRDQQLGVPSASASAGPLSKAGHPDCGLGCVLCARSIKVSKVAGD